MGAQKRPARAREGQSVPAFAVRAPVCTVRKQERVCAIGLRTMHASTTSQGLEVLAQIGYLLLREPQTAPAVIGANHVDQGGGRPIVEIRRVLPTPLRGGVRYCFVADRDA